MKIILSFLTLLLALSGTPVLSQALMPEQVPEPLKPWINWVLQGDAQHGCAFIYNQFEQKQCSWPGQLSLSLNNTQGSFTGYWQVDQESWLFLPGDDQYWPQQVTINNQPAVVVAKDNRPALKLKPGHYDVAGRFNWDYIPEQLRVPDNTGLIQLRINNTPIATPTIKEGLLWLKDSTRDKAGAIADTLEVQVFRQIIDDVPLQILTHIELDIAGTAREVKLSQALLNGFTPMRLDSPLPARVEADGQVVVQARAGHWQLTLQARQTQPKESIALSTNPAWPSSEIWVFAAQPSLRVAEITELAAIDPSQTNLPKAWHTLPAYRINAGQTMNLKIIRRGNPDPEPNQLTLKRRVWLDFDGSGYTLNDQIGGTMTRDWRLNVLPETLLGKVSLNDQSQLITRSATGEVGFEVRQGALNVQADSRYQGAIGDLSVTGWQQTFHQVNTVINLPPGWRLLAASGVDNIPDSWVARWTLLDIFMVLIAAFAVAHLWQIKWGIFTLIALVLTWHEANAPHFIWLNLLAAIALIRVVPKGRMLTLLDNYRKLCGLTLMLIAIPFMVSQVRIGLYPQLEMPWQSMQAAVDNGLASTAPASPTPEMADALTSGGADPALTASGAYSAAKPIAKMRRSTSSKNEYALAEVMRHDTANVQTGPGLPQWQWHKITLAWNGAVDSQQRVKLWFLSPLQTCLLNFLTTALIALLALLLFGFLPVKPKPINRNNAPSSTLPSGLALLLLPLLLMPSAPVKADFPPQTVLDDLKNRLLTPPDCLPSCAQIAQAQISITPDALQLSIQVDAEVAVAIPLPAQQNQWLPEQVILDGVAKTPLMRDAEGQLWLQVTQGRHQLILQGKTPALDKFTLSLPLKPHHITINSTGWEQSGVHEHGSSDSQLQFTRVLKAAQTGDTVQSTTGILPALFSIKRTLQLGLDWHVHTEATRLTPADAAVALRVPLLAGESVLTAGLRVEQQQVLLNIDAAQTEMHWDSVLPKGAQLDLVAPNQDQWTETWVVDVSPLWHLNTEGIAPVHPLQAGDWRPEWRPYPNERLRLLLTQPEAVSGQTLTVDHSQLTVAPGKRITENTLVLHVKSSKGGQHSLTLPANAHLQSVIIDDAMQPIQQQANTVTLPVKPGAQTWQLIWQQTQAVGMRFATPEINIGVASVNSHIKLNMGNDRWVLYTFGPHLGPAVLFWGFLLVMALLAIGLAKSGLTPLKHWQWFLLLLGLSQLPLAFALLVVGWLCLLGLRGREQLPTALYFNAVQVLIVGVTLLAGMCLFSAVEKGLLGSPDMQISGNQSNASDLNWYQDRSAAQLPVAGIISVPLLIYRGLMLLWSLWLAISLLKWLKWGWQCFETGGLWRKLPPKVKA